MLLYIIAIPVVIATVILVLWPRHGKWGVNFKQTLCPRCGTKMPKWRKPENQRQAMWGGWTCTQCGCEMDKYGNALETDTEPET